MMGNVIHSLSVANFSAFTYNQIFTSTSTSVTLNGTTITIVPPMKLDILVTSCTSASPNNVFLVGSRIFYSGSGPIDIKTGLPFLND
jgi:hypothetical protein